METAIGPVGGLLIMLFCKKCGREAGEYDPAKAGGQIRKCEDCRHPSDYPYFDNQSLEYVYLERLKELLQSAKAVVADAQKAEFAFDIRLGMTNKGPPYKPRGG